MTEEQELMQKKMKEFRDEITRGITSFNYASEEERQLADIVHGFKLSTVEESINIAKAITKAGWVKAEKIWEGNTGKNEYQKLYTAMNRNIEVYIREVKA